MKRILLLVALVGIAGIAGIVRSHTNRGDFDKFVSRNAVNDVRDETRQTYQLAPGATVDISSINGSVRIETSETTTAEVQIERTGANSEALSRRKITVEASSNNLRIHGEKGDVGFFARFFGSSPSEKLTLKLPRKISLNTNGVNGTVVVGEIEGAVEVRGVNGRVQIAGASGAEFKGVNGNILVGLTQIGDKGVNLNGINGNVELQLGNAINADFDANGMNGRVVSEISEVTVDKAKHGRYYARIGNGGSQITAKGINGNIRLTRSGAPTEVADVEKSKSDSASSDSKSKK